MKKTIKLQFDMAPLFENVIVTALEGGSNYWCDIHDQFPDTPKGYAPTERLALSLVNNPKFKVDVFDAETDEKLGELTQAAMLKGLQLAVDTYPHAVSDLLSENYDAETTDIILQLVVLGEVVYG
jgi:hypothetical protein